LQQYRLVPDRKQAGEKNTQQKPKEKQTGPVMNILRCLFGC